MPKPKLCRALEWKTLPLFVSALISLSAAGYAQEGGGCLRETISIQASPDDKWIALVQEDTCSDGHFVTVVNDVVELTLRNGLETILLKQHPDAPRHENDIFSTEEHGAPEFRPVTRWLTPTSLEITVPNKSLIGLKKKTYEGIDISVKYVPDNLKEREEWRKSRNLPEINE